ncbi:restriction endonuclease subunit S [Francisella hispaniensis]|uniref:restriction endonuclease subunit S n=1 Tax=Francisella hispaniensis TaxID=622488 RepID=UPI001903A7BE
MIGTIGSPTIVDFEPDFAIKNVALFKPSDTYLIELLKYWLSSHITTQKMLEEAKGATQKFVGLTYLRNFPAPLPPLAEQKRIVAKLDSLFEKIDKAIELHQQNITNVNTLMASTLDKTFKKLEAEYNLVSLDKMTNVVGGGTPKRDIKEYWENGEIVWLSPTDLGAIGEILNVRESRDKITKLGLSKSSARLLPVGTVLYSSRATIGKIAINEIEVCTNQGFTNFICNKDKIYNYFLAYCLAKYTEEITSLSNSTTFKEVSKTSIKKFKIPLPPLLIQQQTLEYLDSIATKVDKIKQLNEQKLENLKALKASILDKAFRGEL